MACRFRAVDRRARRAVEGSTTIPVSTTGRRDQLAQEQKAPNGHPGGDFSAQAAGGREAGKADRGAAGAGRWGSCRRPSPGMPPPGAETFGGGRRRVGRRGAVAVEDPGSMTVEHADRFGGRKARPATCGGHGRWSSARHSSLDTERPAGRFKVYPLGRTRFAREGLRDPLNNRDGPARTAGAPRPTGPGRPARGCAGRHAPALGLGSGGLAAPRGFVGSRAPGVRC